MAADPSLFQDIAQVPIEEEMKRSYLDYAMSVIVSRALPDVRDGLKPVHRRILYAMLEGGNHWNRGYRKSANIVGNVMGNYHPHGDGAIYDAMVRMAQNFSLRLPLVDGQGNFGSMDGDPPAAMRYTEARLEKVAHEILADIDKDTVPFQANYDNTREEPIVLPSKFPNLLVNGAGGIAVGMATNIAPHNLGEVIDACCACLDNPNISILELTHFIPGPDFPTGGIIIGRKGIFDAFSTGRGSIIMQGRTEFETVRKERQAIIITEIPYQVNKSKLIERFAELAQEKIIEGIADLRDESDRHGVRVVVELKKDAEPNVVLNQLYHYSSLRTSFGVNCLALNQGRPEMMNLKDILVAFIRFREEVVTRRTTFELKEARARAHVLMGLVIAVTHIDEVIELIKSAEDPGVAKDRLLAREWPIADIVDYIRLVDPQSIQDDQQSVYKLSELQAKAILDLRLQRLTGLERDKIADELRALSEQIKDFLDILASRERVKAIIRQELQDIKTAFATPRRTSIEDIEMDQDIESLIQVEDMVVTVTHGGYIKRVPLSTYRAQRRGGKGRSGMATKDEDFVDQIYITNTHTDVLFFSNLGMVYKLKVYKLPLGNPQAKGKALVNLLPLDQGEIITTIMLLPQDDQALDALDIVFATAKGNVRRNKLVDFVHVMSNGKIAMKLEEGDRLIGVQSCHEKQDIMLATHFGKSIRFPVTDVRVFVGRVSTGVRGIKLAQGDEVISLSLLNHTDFDADERRAYLRQAQQKRRQNGDMEEHDLLSMPLQTETAENDSDESANGIITLSPERFGEMELAEEFILAVTENGFGKRTSAYEYRITGRGGQGIGNIETSTRNGQVIATFSIKHDDEIMLITNKGQLIRMAVDDIRITGRRTMGVTLFRIEKDETVVSASLVAETENSDVLE